MYSVPAGIYVSCTVVMYDELCDRWTELCKYTYVTVWGKCQVSREVVIVVAQ